MPKYIDADEFVSLKREWYCDQCEKRKGMKRGRLQFVYEIGGPPCRACDVDDMISDIEAFPAVDMEPKPITGETSDGYHTFNELYHHRAVLFSVIVRCFRDRAWKARQHHDGTMFDGMFIVGIETPDGQATYHYDVDPYWDMFECRELDRAPEWDGHTPAEAIERIGSLSAEDVKSTWIPVEEGLPQERDTIFARFYGTEKWKPGMIRRISDDVRVVAVFEDGTAMVWHDHTVDGVWSCEKYEKNLQRKITHWMENPELPKGEE